MTRLFHRFLRPSWVLLGLLAWLQSSMALADAPNNQNLQILRRGNGAEIDTLDPARSETINDGHVQQDLFEGLVTLDPRDQVVPAAAQSWTISPDGLHYVFTLRPDLRWSNGARLTSEDFVYSFRRVVDPATGSDYAFLYFPIRNAQNIAEGRIHDLAALGVAAPTPNTLTIDLAAPTPYFLGLLAHAKFLPVYRPAVERWGMAWTQPGHLVSNGAFTLTEWTPQSRMVLSRNPYFHDAAHVHLDRVIYLPIENEDEELKLYRAGELDITSTVPAGQMRFIHRYLQAEFHVFPMLGTYYYGLNLTRAPFKGNKKLRQALSMVIDREALTSKVLRTGEIPAYSWVPDGIPGYAPAHVPWATWPMARRIAMARQLYAEAGYGPGHPLHTSILYNTSNNHRQIAIAVAAMWRDALGVQTDLVNQEFKVYLETRRQKHDTQIYRGGWIADYADASSFTDLLRSTSGLNDFGYANPLYDNLTARAATMADVKARNALLADAEAMILDDTPLIPLYQYVLAHMVKPYVHGFHPNVLDYSYSKDITLGPHQ
ncbi:MAG TPA: peptide ABC transporter substrate-binding protein [Stellaceae bacterium]|nr:peptide ABC transporter substrate-binding protein [Stellaceae bacterium]